MALRNPRYLAGGNIYPSRIVKIDASGGANFTVIQAAAATDKGVGISQEGTKRPPGVLGEDGLAAHAGEHIQVYSAGQECLLQLGGTVTQGDDLTADSNGKGVAVNYGSATGVVHIVAFALESGAADELIRVFVHPKTIKFS